MIESVYRLSGYQVFGTLTMTSDITDYSDNAKAALLINNPHFLFHCVCADEKDPA